MNAKTIALIGIHLVPVAHEIHEKYLEHKSKANGKIKKKK